MVDLDVPAQDIQHLRKAGRPVDHVQEAIVLAEKVVHVDLVQLGDPARRPLGGPHLVERILEAVGHRLRQNRIQNHESIAPERLPLGGGQTMIEPGTARGACVAGNVVSHGYLLSPAPGRTGCACPDPCWPLRRMRGGTATCACGASRRAARAAAPGMHSQPWVSKANFCSSVSGTTGTPSALVALSRRDSGRRLPKLSQLSSNTNGAVPSAVKVDSPMTHHFAPPGPHWQVARGRRPRFCKSPASEGVAGAGGVPLALDAMQPRAKTTRRHGHSVTSTR